MKKLFFIMLLLSGFISGMQRMSLDTRAVCAPCVTGSAQFCNICVSNAAVIKDLVVQNSLTVCSGATGPFPCNCIFDGEISWNTDESHFNIKQQTGPISPTPFQPYSPNPASFSGAYFATFTGWPIPPSTVEIPLVITVEFQVPRDLDPAVTPTITLHWFNPSATFEPICTGNYINWQVFADFFTNLAPINNPFQVPKYMLTTGDILLTYYTGPEPAGFVQQQITIPLTGPALVPGAYAQITAARIAPTGAGHVESSCNTLLTLITFQYQKVAQ